eukprot:COSAG01_NODE_1148_length_11519_cov_3.641944_6_plen_149_part_00
MKLAYDAHPGGCVLVTDAMPAMGRKQKTAGLAPSLVPTAWPPTVLDRSSRPPLPTPRALVRLAVPPGEGFAIGEMKVDVLGPEDAGSANGRCGKAVLTGTTTLAGSVATMIDCVPTCLSPPARSALTNELGSAEFWLVQWPLLAAICR